MLRVKSLFAVVGAVALGGVSLSGCATEDYVNKQIAAAIAPVNDHIAAVDRKADAAMAQAQTAQTTAQAAQSSANAAQASAQTAATSAQDASARVGTLEQMHAKQPRN
jgi:outer membrane murein-binding lipoprotein Lpp